MVVEYHYLSVFFLRFTHLLNLFMHPRRFLLPASLKHWKMFFPAQNTKNLQQAARGITGWQMSKRRENSPLLLKITNEALFSLSMDGKACLHLCVCMCAQISECIIVFVSWLKRWKALLSPQIFPNWPVGWLHQCYYINPHCAACIPGACVHLRLCVFGQ